MKIIMGNMAGGMLGPPPPKITKPEFAPKTHDFKKASDQNDGGKLVKITNQKLTN